MAFNINTQQLADTTTFQLNDVQGNPIWADSEETLPVQIEVYGKSSKAFRNWGAIVARKQLARKGKVFTQEEQAENTADFLVAITKTTYNLEIDGVPVTDADSMKAMYSNPSLFWVGEQVSEKLGELGAFLQK